MDTKTVILLIEDENNVRKTIKMLLEAMGGYKVITASDGKEGIKQANMFKPNLILLDINMPEMDGMHTLKILKECTTTVKIPVVMLTGYSEDVYKVHASQLYDEDYILKPVDGKELVDRIEKVLSRRK